MRSNVFLITLNNFHINYKLIKGKIIEPHFPPQTSSPLYTSVPLAVASRKRRDLDEEGQPEAKASFSDTMAQPQAAPALEAMGEIKHLFFTKVPYFCEDVGIRLGYPIDQVDFHREFIARISHSIPSQGDLTVEKVLELTRMMLGQSLNLTGNTIRHLLADNELMHKCDSLRSRLLTMTIQDLDSQYDDVADRWISGPLFGDIKNFCNEVEVTLLSKIGQVWQMRFAIHYSLNPPSQ